MADHYERRRMDDRLGRLCRLVDKQQVPCRALVPEMDGRYTTAVATVQTRTRGEELQTFIRSATYYDKIV